MSATCAHRIWPSSAEVSTDLSRRLLLADQVIPNVITVAVRPKYFEDFYTLIDGTRGNFYSLVRDGGSILARYPLRNNRAARVEPD